MFLGILLFAKFAHGHNATRTLPIVATSILPLSLPIVDLLLQRHWDRLHQVGVRISRPFVALSPLTSLNVLLTLVPIATLAVLSIYTPLLTSRGLLLFVPYAIAVSCVGLASLLRRRGSWAILVLTLLVVHVFSIRHWRQVTHSPNDYKGLAEQWIPEIGETDLIFVQRHWVTTPVFYYLKADRYQFVGSDYAQELRKRGSSRVWVLSFPGLAPSSEMREALAGYGTLMTIDATRIRTELYGRPR